MKTNVQTIKTLASQAACIFWCHRATYVVLALTYAAQGAGMLGSGMLYVVAAIAYAAMSTQRH